ncbi:MAG: ATP-binding cassette domain-containing protein [Treponema sp.]|nr:ATP-binding cassette domain-containing protein [Candidatus Treponema equifaecale]
MQIKLENLKKYYGEGESQIHAVDDISLDIPENKIFGIIGKSGAGKSSLVRLVSLLEKPDSGAVYYGERRVDNLSEKDLIAERRKIGMIFQNFNLFFSRNAGKNIAYPLEIAKTPKTEIKQRVEEMIKLVGLEDRIEAPVSTLSGGQKQRIAIARALSTKPHILFCDEATSALDPQTTRNILALIREIQKKMNLTVVMITHQMEVIRDACDYVAVVESGKIVEQGKVSEIFANPKTETTKDFIKNLTHNSDDEKSNIVTWSNKKAKYVLHFIGDTTGAPVLSQTAKKFNVDFNILAAGIEKLPESQVGSMSVDISGEEEEIKKAVEFIESQGVRVTVEGE